MTFPAKLEQYGLPLVIAAVSAIGLSGCSVLEPDYEAEQRQALQQVGQGLGIDHFGGHSQATGGGALTGTPATLPQLDKTAGAEDYLRFALLKHPRVQGAFYRWWQQVEAITPARSLPDPALVFQADIADTVLSLMPGIMMDIPGWGKLEAAGLQAAAGATVAYREYLAALHVTAAQLRSAAAQLDYSTQMVELGRQRLLALEQSVAVAGAQYGTGSGSGGASLQMQTEWMDAQAAMQAELESRLETLAVARARFKAALGLQRAEADPYWPSGIFTTGETLSEDALWEQALLRNPQLETLRSAVLAALAQLDVAETAGTPDFAVGLMADVKMNPVMFRPELGMSLPVWRDKIAAILLGAQAGALAAQSSLEQTQLELAVELAQSVATLRRSEREFTYLQTHALPNSARALASADVGYRAGGGDFASLVSLQLAQLQVQEQLAAAQMERSLALASIALLTARPLPDAGLVSRAAQ